eukprot:2764269-Rhodomonas_salina.1
MNCKENDVSSGHRVATAKGCVEKRRLIPAPAVPHTGAPGTKTLEVSPRQAMHRAFSRNQTQPRCWQELFGVCATTIFTAVKSFYTSTAWFPPPQHTAKVNKNSVSPTFYYAAMAVYSEPLQTHLEGRRAGMCPTSSAPGTLLTGNE